MMDEHAAVIQISAEASSVGEVMSANRAILRVFGFPPSHLIGRNVSEVMPTPFRDVHDSFLLRAIKEGGRRVVDTTR